MAESTEQTTCVKFKKKFLFFDLLIIFFQGSADLL